MATETQAQPTKVKTGKVRLSYASIWHPVAQGEDGTGEKKYSTAILIPKTDKKMVKEIEAAIEAAKQMGKSKWGGKFPAKLKMPLRDGDEERPDDDNYAGMYFLNATSKGKPGIIDLNLKEITDEEEVYSGCYARVSINFYPFATKGNNGVAAGLNNIQKLRDGDPLGGRIAASEDFNDDFEFEDDEENADDLI